MNHPQSEPALSWRPSVAALASGGSSPRSPPGRGTDPRFFVCFLNVAASFGGNSGKFQNSRHLLPRSSQVDKCLLGGFFWFFLFFPSLGRKGVCCKIRGRTFQNICLNGSKGRVPSSQTSLKLCKDFDIEVPQRHTKSCPVLVCSVLNLLADQMWVELCSA